MAVGWSTLQRRGAALLAAIGLVAAVIRLSVRDRYALTAPIYYATPAIVRGSVIIRTVSSLWRIARPGAR